MNNVIMKPLYLLGCVASYARFMSSIDDMFYTAYIRNSSITEADRCASNGNRSNRNAAQAFPVSELYMIVYYNMVFTLVFGIAIVYSATLFDRVAAIWGFDPQLLTKLRDSPLLGNNFLSSSMLQMLKFWVVHNIVVVVVTGGRLNKIRTKREAVFVTRAVYALSTLFAMLV